MILLVVNFHYIDEEDKYPKGGIYPVSVKRFSRQIEELGRFFRFVSQDELRYAVENNKKIPERSCLITFDDGLISQYEKALPILRRRGVPAIFFVNSLPIENKRACTVHKIHWLRSIIDSDSFRNIINEKIMANFRSDIEAFFKNKNIKNMAEEKYRYDDQKTRQVKFLLNNLLNSEERSLIIDEIFKEFVASEENFVEKFYLSKKQIIHLYELGCLGIHSYTHMPLSFMDAESIEADISHNKKTIENITEGKINSISYPYGGPKDINKKVVNICKKLGLILGFTMERSFNTTLKHPLLLARADTNDVVGGKNPTFRINKKIVEIFGRFGEKRNIYVKE